MTALVDGYPTTEEHYPETRGDDGHVRCACSYRWPCPTVRSGPRPLETGEWDLLRSLDITVGYSVWRRQPEGSELDPVGGMVVGSFTDDNGSTVFRLLDFPRGRHRYTTLRLVDVEPSTVGLPNGALLRSYARKLAAIVGKQRGTATGEELELLADAVDLLKAV